MDKIIGALSAHVLGQIVESDALRESTAGKLRGQLGALSRAGVSAMAFTLAGMTLMATPTVAKAELIGTLVGAGGGGLLGSLIGKGNGQKAAIAGGAVVGGAAGNNYSDNMRALSNQQALEREQANQRNNQRPGDDVIGPQFPSNESLAPNSSNGTAKSIGTVAGAVVGAIGGHFVGAGLGKTLATVGGGVIGAVAGRTAADMATAPSQVGVGQVAYTQTPDFGRVAVSPAPWGNLSPFMAQIEGFSQPTRSLASNPQAAASVEAAMEQIESLKRGIQIAAQQVDAARNGQVLAVSKRDMNQGVANERAAEMAYTEAQQVYMGTGVLSLRNKLDNLSLQGYDLRGYKVRAMQALDVLIVPLQPNQKLHLRGFGHFNPQIARMVLEMPTQNAPAAQQAYATAQTAQPQTYATAQTGSAQAAAQQAQTPPSGQVPGVDYNHLVKIVNGKIVEVSPQGPAVAQGGAPTMSPADAAANEQVPADQLPQGVTSRLKSRM